MAFGAPKAVQQAFVEKMKQCWLKAPGVLAGARYEAGERTDTAEPIEQIAIHAAKGSNQVFIIEFHKFNSSTLIAIRDRGFPQQLAAQLKRDVEGWVLERPGCTAPEAAVAVQTPAVKANPAKPKQEGLRFGG